MSEPDVRADAVEEDAEELYEEAPCGYLSTTPDGAILRANRTFLALSGYDADELVGVRRFADLLPPGGKIYYETHLAPLLRMQGQVREIALELVRPDGRRVPVLVSAALKQDASGRARLIRVTVFDATDRRRYEQELLQARAEAEARGAAATALEHVAEGVVLVDEDGRIRLLNPAAERIFGVVEEDVRGLPLTAVSADWATVEPRIAAARAGDEPPVPAVVPLELLGGTRWLAASAAAASGGVVYTLRDVTEERRLEDLRDDVVAIVSHELRTPLAGVYGAAQTLTSLGDRLDEAQRSELIAVIGEQSARLARIVDQIVLTGKLDSGEMAPVGRTFELHDAVERVLAGMRATHADGRLVSDPDGAVETVDVEGDPKLFEQVLANLVDNAIRYGPPDGEVRVTVARVRTYGRVTVADAGPGIPPADRERIFERFLRLDPVRSGDAAGIGLGLYIARELVRRMHGRLGLLPSERGTAFHVDLPLGHGGAPSPRSPS
jgi:PAS domain S-box-containing protein